MQGLPPDLRLHEKMQALLAWMMESDPARRPANMAEVKTALLALNLPRVPFILSARDRPVYLD